jgi:hypothetical protein
MPRVQIPTSHFVIHPSEKVLVTTTTSIPTSSPPPIPSAPKPSAAIAAADLVSSWASGNQAEARSVATVPAVAALFAGHYSSGLVIDRGCSVAFVPLVCTYGPPRGADPTDPSTRSTCPKRPPAGT